MRRFAVAALAVGFAFSSTAYAAAPCRDATGKFIKCAPAPASKCRDTKGKFTKCEAAPGKTG